MSQPDNSDPDQCIIISIWYDNQFNFDQKVWAMMAEHIQNYQPLLFTRSCMGDNSSESDLKPISITYAFNGLIKIRSAQENETLPFNRDLRKIWYGKGDTWATWLGRDYYFNKPELVKDLYEAFDKSGQIAVTNQLLLARPDDDPAETQTKQLVVEYIYFEIPGQGQTGVLSTRRADQNYYLSFQDLV